MIQLELYFKKPSKEARTAMCEAALQTARGNRDAHMQAVEDEICTMTGHEYSRAVNSGNSAILAAMSAVKGKILIPDQGGWKGFLQMAQFLDREIAEIPTESGLIYPDILLDIIRKEQPEAIFITSLAGYTAEQPLRDIYQICDEAGVVLVEDASGALGDEKDLLANGNHSHIIVASTGSPKIVNVGNGGFISTNNKKFLENENTILKTMQADYITCAGLSKEIKYATQVLSKTMASCDYLKKQLDNVYHPDKRGINVIMPSNDPSKFAKELKMKLKVHDGGMLTKCPNYNRVMDNAVALEIKNLDVRCLTVEKLKKIVNLIKSVPI